MCHNLCLITWECGVISTQKDVLNTPFKKNNIFSYVCKLYVDEANYYLLINYVYMLMTIFSTLLVKFCLQETGLQTNGEPLICHYVASYSAPSFIWNCLTGQLYILPDV